MTRKQWGIWERCGIVDRDMKDWESVDWSDCDNVNDEDKEMNEDVKNN